MAASGNVAPVIIKKKKVIAGDGHHGGAWKVAYADFVTAMMAFFMLMWLLNATTENQRQGLADYFTPSIMISRVSGGGEGSFYGSTLFSAENYPEVGQGTPPAVASELELSSALTGYSQSQEKADKEAFEKVESMLVGSGGESMVSDDLQKHIVTRVTDEGLVIELFALNGKPLFKSGSAEATPLLTDLLDMVGRVTALVTNDVAVGAHVRSEPIVLADNPIWEGSASRAERARQLLVSGGVDPSRLRRVTGHADRKPAVANPMAIRNNRVEIVLLRY